VKGTLVVQEIAETAKAVTGDVVLSSLDLYQWSLLLLLQCCYDYTMISEEISIENYDVRFCRKMVMDIKNVPDSPATKLSFASWQNFLENGKKIQLKIKTHKEGGIILLTLQGGELKSHFLIEK
jgi:hypothetical protein